MILPDVNTLVYAFREEAPQHEAYRDWLTEAISGGDDLAVVDHCLAGMVRIVTNARIFEDPAPTPLALTFTLRLSRAPRARPVAATGATWDLLSRWADDDAGIKGNLLPDAYLAALAVTHGARLASADRGFSRFPGLDWFDPRDD